MSEHWAWFFLLWALSWANSPHFSTVFIAKFSTTPSVGLPSMPTHATSATSSFASSLIEPWGFPHSQLSFLTTQSQSTQYTSDFTSPRRRRSLELAGPYKTRWASARSPTFSPYITTTSLYLSVNSIRENALGVLWVTEHHTTWAFSFLEHLLNSDTEQECSIYLFPIFVKP